MRLLQTVVKFYGIKAVDHVSAPFFVDARKYLLPDPASTQNAKGRFANERIGDNQAEAEQ